MRDRDDGKTVDDDPCTETPSLYENIDSEDALSVYDVYTVWTVLIFSVAICDNSYSFYRIILLFGYCPRNFILASKEFHTFKFIR